MYRCCSSVLRSGILVALMAVVPLSACATGGLGASAFGSSKQLVADLSGRQPTTPEAALAEARAHFRNNDFGYSAAFYQRVVELSPENTEGYVGLGASYDRLGRFDLSDRVYAGLYRLSGDTAQYYNNVGYSYMLRGNLTAALTNFRRALSLDPDNVLIANNIQMLTSAATRT
jgi:Flp pilus assembly protein TadD